jgi:hypothetical protein
MAMISVGGVALPAPSKFEWSLQDVSIGESGRSDDGTMYKGRICQKRKIVLEWAGKTPSVIHQVLTAFNPEYINVTYFDPLDNATATREFYVGDRSAPVKIWTVNDKIYETLGFDIIER